MVQRPFPSRLCFGVLPLLVAPLTACAADGADGGGGQRPQVAQLAPGDPLATLDDALVDAFQRGDAAFELPHREGSGLGPLYIRTSCNACHVGDLKGPGLVQKMSVVGPDGFTPSADQSLLPFGHTVRPLTAAGATQGIFAPSDASVKVTIRIGPPVIGRGYLEAIADSEIERMEAEQAGRTDGIHGRIARVTYHSERSADDAFHTHVSGDEGLIGRFGLKARVATLDDFTADAFQGDMGLTSPLRPEELPNPDGLEDDALPGVDLDLDTIADVATYLRLLAIPTREDPGEGGAELFERARCAVCHAPSLRTREGYPVAALAGIEAPVYSDLLLHDMGPALADGMADEHAGAREWRTAPLIGLRFNRRHLHDGRASSVREAIDLHGDEGSEAADSVARFQAFTEEERAALVRWVESR